MKENKLRSFLYSAAGVALVLVALVALNFILGRLPIRLDLTEAHLHTLSPGTRDILGRIAKGDSDVTVNFYVSQKGNRLPPMEEAFARQVEDLLAEFKSASGGHVRIKKLDPAPDSEVEDAAKLDGVEPQMSQQTGEPYYLGLSVILDPQKVSIPALSVQRDKLLEYDIARAVSQVTQTNKPVVGIMTPLPIMGTPSNPFMARMGQQGSEPWVFVSELKRDFDVQTVAMDSEAIDPKVQVLLLVHPKDITDKAQYAIDQFVLRGGRLVAMLDSLCMADNRQPNQMGFNMGGGSTLPRLLKAWGLEFTTNQVVADAQNSREINFGRGPQAAPAFLFLNKDAVAKGDALFEQTDDLLLPFSGAFTGKPADGLKEEVLLSSSKDSQLVDPITSQLNGQKVRDDLTPSGIQYALAVRLTGKFKTAFGDGRPDSGNTNAVAEVQLKEGKAENTVYLFGDSDFLYDPYCVRVDRMFRVATPFNGNLSLGQSLIEQVAGDPSLIGARSRASVRRPFTVVQKKQAEAQKRFQVEISRLQKDVEEAQTKISEIQSKKEGNQKFILSPESKAALDNLTRKQTEANKNLRKVRKDLRQEVEAMENKFTWANIAAMPLVVIVVGIGRAVLRRKRTAAK